MKKGWQKKLIWTSKVRNTFIRNKYRMEDTMTYVHVPLSILVWAIFTFTCLLIAGFFISQAGTDSKLELCKEHYYICESRLQGAYSECLGSIDSLNERIDRVCPSTGSGQRVIISDFNRQGGDAA